MKKIFIEINKYNLIDADNLGELESLIKELNLFIEDIQATECTIIFQKVDK